MRVFVESLFQCDAEMAWSAVQNSEVLVEVAAPLVLICPPKDETFPQRWAAGSSVRCRCILFGILPLVTRTLRFERIDSLARQIQTRETDPLVRRWDHLISIRPADNGCCWYSDEIEIEAGWRTPFVWLFASVLYSHRQRRWKKRIVRRLMAQSTPH